MCVFLKTISFECQSISHLLLYNYGVCVCVRGCVFGAIPLAKIENHPHVLCAVLKRARLRRFVVPGLFLGSHHSDILHPMSNARLMKEFVDG